jgi:uncharacterized protein (DUF305 family)
MSPSFRPTLATCALVVSATLAAPRFATAQSPAHDSSTPHGTTAQRAVSAADVRFMQGMIGHHAQALVMAALVPTHTGNPSLQLLAQRIAISQRDEIALMQQWLRDRHQQVPAPSAARTMHDGMMHDSATHAMHMQSGTHADEHTMDMAHDVRMPGMLTPAQLQQLSNARGAEFDRLFLRDMIAHHAGALVMVSDLLAAPGAAQDPAVFQFASDVDAGQRAEIARMRTLLDTLESGSRK